MHVIHTAEVVCYFVGSMVVCWSGMIICYSRCSLWKRTKVTFRIDADWIRCGCHSPLTPYPVTWLASAASSCRRAGWRMLCRQVQKKQTFKSSKLMNDRIIIFATFKCFSESVCMHTVCWEPQWSTVNMSCGYLYWSWQVTHHPKASRDKRPFQPPGQWT